MKRAIGIFMLVASAVGFFGFVWHGMSGMYGWKRGLFHTLVIFCGSIAVTAFVAAGCYLAASD